MIPTVAQVVSEIQSLLGDVPGRIFTPALAQTGFNRAYEYLRAAMLRDQVPRIVVIAQAVVPAGTRQFSPESIGINNFGELIELHERPVASTEDWVPLTETTITNGPEGTTLGVFEWREDQFFFYGCTADRELRVRYYDSGQPPVAGPVGIDGSLLFLSYYGAAAIGPSKGYDDAEVQRMLGKALGPRLDGSGGYLFDLLQPMVRSSHRVQKQQQPYGRYNGFRSRPRLHIAAPAPAPAPAVSGSTPDPWLISTDFDFTPQAPVNSLAIGPNVITLAPVPRGVNGTDTGHYLYISGGSGTAEAVLITGGTALSGAPTGTVIVNCANTHSGSWTIRSATKGMQEAVNTLLPDVGGQIILPATDFAVYATTLITGHHITIRGLGISAPTIFATNMTAEVFRFDGGSGNRLQDMSIDGTGLTGASAFAIVLDDQNTTALSNVNINLAPNGIKLTGPNIYRVFLDDINVAFIPGAGVGILIEDGADHYLSRVAMANSVFATAGIRITKTAGTWMDSLSILGTLDSLLIDPSSGVMGFLFVSNSAFDSPTGNCIKIVPTGSAVVHNVFFVDSWSASGGGSGVYIEALGSARAEDIHFASHRSINNDQFGFFLNGAGVAKVSIANSNISSNGHATPDGLYDGIHVANGANRLTIVNNSIGSSGDLPADHRYGIYLGPSAINKVIITGNRINDFAPAASSIAHNASGLEFVIEDNEPNNIISGPTITAAATLDLTNAPFDRYDITGNAVISTIVPAWYGRKVALTFTNAAPGGLTTGGNIRKAKTISQNQTVLCIYDAGGWCCL